MRPKAGALFLAQPRARIDAKKTSQSEYHSRLFSSAQLTLQKLLTGVLLEEGLVADRTGKIVNHEMHNWLYLLLSIPSIV